jgi:ribosomal protein S18 acetylase RimI-like enzyme
MFSPGHNFDIYTIHPYRVLGDNFRITVLNRGEDLERSAELDALAFEGQVGADAEYFGKIALHGFALGIEDETGDLLAQAHVVTEPIPDAMEPGVVYLRPGHAYFEGLSTHPEARGRGLGQVLIKAVDIVLEAHAKYTEKTHILTTIRPTNYASLRTFTSCGYAGVGFAYDYYTVPGVYGDRILFSKRITSPRPTDQSAQVEETLVFPREGTLDDPMRSDVLYVTGLRGLALTSVKTCPQDRTKFKAEFTSNKKVYSRVPKSTWLNPAR